MAFGAITQSKTGSDDNTASHAIVFDSTPTEGNLLLACHFTGNEDSQTPSGFTEAVALTDSGNTDQGAIYYKVAGSSESTTVTLLSASNDESSGTIFEIEGPWNASPLDKTATSGPGSGSSRSSGTTATTSQNDEFAVALITIREDAAAFGSWTNSFTERSEVETNFKQHGTATLVLTSTGAYETTTTITGDAGQDSMGGIATFKKSAAGGDPQVSAQDDATVSDAVTAAVSDPQTSAQDDAVVSESIVAALQVDISAQDDATITDAVTASLESYVTTTDSIAVAETVTVSPLQVDIVTQDDATATDSVTVEVESLGPAALSINMTPSANYVQIV